MTDAERREAARQFCQRWKGRGREDEDARSYWIEFLQNIIGMGNVTERVDFEKKVVGPDGNRSSEVSFTAHVASPKGATWDCFAAFRQRASYF